VRRALADAGLEPGRLEVDVAEGVLLRDPDAALPTLTALKAQGVRIAVDDFGSGYSSLSCLQRFPFDALKIDRTLIAQLGGSADAAAVVQAVVTLGRGLGLRTTAEGVERADQLAFLETAACDDVQGYFCGPPEPAASIGRLLRDERTGRARRPPAGRRRARRSA
jgi:EAL domain-containing protein (putative c-di-GMP-specific phosphodiesterase class I)